MLGQLIIRSLVKQAYVGATLGFGIELLEN